MEAATALKACKDGSQGAESLGQQGLGSKASKK